MSRNLTAPRLRWRQTNPMRDHDSLPAPLRLWAAQAALPWSARSLRRAWNRSLATSGTPQAALARLSAAEAATLARQAAQVWGPDYPAG